jgi:S1-C subfamily serine protease
MRKQFRVFPRFLVIVVSLIAASATLAVAQPNAEKKGSPREAPAGAEQQSLPEQTDLGDQAGVLVAAVLSGGPADRAGIVRGDIILEAAGKAVNAPEELRAAVEAKKPGDSLALKVRHGSDVRNLTVTLADQAGRPWIGVAPSPNPNDAIRTPFEGMMGVAQGASVMTVAKDGPADKAGIAAGDVILSVDAKEVQAGGSLGDLIAAHKAGDVVTLSVRSPGREARDVKVTLGEKSDAETAWLGIEYTSAWARGLGGGGLREGPGFALPKGGFGAMAGVLVAQVAPDGPAAKAGMKEGDLITAVEGVRVRSPRSVAEAVAAHKPGDSLTVTVARMPDGTSTDLEVTLGENPSDKTKGYLGVSMSSFFGLQGPARPDSDSGAPPMMPWPRMPRFNAPAPTPPGI